MFVVITSNDEFELERAESLVPGLRTYWGQRGMPVHHMDFRQTAKEAAVAANYHLMAAKPGDAKPTTTALLNAIWNHRGTEFWADIFFHRAAKETASWLEKDLNYIVLLTNMSMPEYELTIGKFGPHMRVEVEDLAPTLKDPTWIDVAQKQIIVEFASRQREGFK